MSNTQHQTKRVYGEMPHAFQHEFSTAPVGAYGLHRATVRTADGRESSALGYGERRAYLNALRLMEKPNL